MRNLTNKTKAFTMIELVFVIVVLGILAALALPRMERDLRQEASDNILSAIRYTQHLALNDNKSDPTPTGTNWQRSLWTIRFASDGDHYTIGSDTDRLGDIDKIEAAVDPINGKYMYNNTASPQDNESPNIFLNKKYGITTIAISGCGIATGTTTALHIAFDNFGRPFRGVGAATNNYDKYVNQDCTITFTAADAFPGDPIVINIAQETGYASIVDQEDL